MSMSAGSIPGHLLQYTVEQDYALYTPADQAVWRYLMGQLKAYLSVHAHFCYTEGLKKTGITTEEIPRIAEISQKLEHFGWRAMAVSGFIPPATFMELQAYGVLPIACAMRSIEHLAYTPAPDIVHEAAGHAPILVDPAFSAYLKCYAQAAKRAIISREDLDQYQAIRTLSDLKEDPRSTPQEIQAATDRLAQVNSQISFVSEAAMLSRINWWTAEYGLIGSVKSPKIYGAGLLSSLGEARSCLQPQVKKIPLSADCVHFSYDITEPQPQLFVTPSFEHLVPVLEELISTLSYRRGGRYGLECAIKAATVNTFELDSGLQISSHITSYLIDEQTGEPAYVRCSGPTQLCAGDQELSGQGIAHHPTGFGTPVGPLKNHTGDLSTATDSELRALGALPGRPTRLEFQSGVVVDGVLREIQRWRGRNLIFVFEACTVRRGAEILFDPTWGVFDMAIGQKIVSVFGGPADRPTYGETESFAIQRLSPSPTSKAQKALHSLYSDVRRLRREPSRCTTQALAALWEKAQQCNDPHHWLLVLELWQLSGQTKGAQVLTQSIRQRLESLATQNPHLASHIHDGIAA